MPGPGVLCASCQFYVATNEKGGVCRRNPPTVFLIQGPPGPLGQSTVQTPSLWPGVDAESWCGHHQNFGPEIAVPFDGRLARDMKGEA